jgi:hypothetical protein
VALGGYRGYPTALLCAGRLQISSDVFGKYTGLMEQWIELARKGRSSDDLPPAGVEPTPERAAKLDGRLRFIRTNVGPFLNG